eukprot:TRINITY_DN13831_c0_g1_i1.p1 TRINITY_DN13831_c0_g1~~TRINITY_DN13831_c0_g1_i1.p1  ORF type:complete len:63 (-),score=4.55 TRINITY_DN13831_c0_g1_i1:105-293(-)
MLCKTYMTIHFKFYLSLVQCFNFPFSFPLFFGVYFPANYNSFCSLFAFQTVSGETNRENDLC